MLDGIQILFVILFLILLVFLVGRILFIPLRWVLKLGYNSLLGFISLWIFNLIGSFVDFHLPINIVTVLIAGILGIPGLILLIILRVYLGL